MCGINGYIKRGGNITSIEDMNKALIHRGPDYAGTYEDETIALGHTLLSIRETPDLSHQPYTKENSPWVLLFNGQLYNTAALKKEIGKEFSGVDLDTSLLFGIIEKYGWDFIYYIQGMFAIALYNKVEGVIRIYRDPSGQKNLYYYQKNDAFIFSSEIKSILSHTIDKEMDEEAVMVSVHIGYIPGNKTIFKHIKKLDPSEYVHYSLTKNELRNEYYKSEAKEYYPENFEKAFEILVEEHLQSKEKVALNLSGGLDSSLILHEMSGQRKEIHTYTTFFDIENGGEKFNRDALLARKLAHDYKTDHHEIVVSKKSFLQNLTESFSIIEEPNFNISLPVYLQTAKIEGMQGDKNRVILSGDGGDEIFGGYPHYQESLRMEKQIKLLSPFIFNRIKNYRNNTDFNFANIDERWFFFRDFYFRAMLQDSSKDVLTYLKKSIAPLVDMYGNKKDAVYQTMLRDRFLWMPGENFIRSDKLYMSQSVEMRSPLSYHPFRLFCDKKLRTTDYVDKSGNKLFLRNLYSGKLPDYITKRPDKTGWSSPVSLWYDKEYKKVFLEILQSVKNNHSLIDWQKVIKRVEENETWPGKYIHLYLSLAILSKKFNVEI